MKTIRHYDDPENYPGVENGEVTEYPNEYDEYDYLGNSASATDCTGLITHGFAAGDIWEPYEEIYPFLPPYDEEL